MVKWVFEEVKEDEVERLSREYGIPRLAAEIALRRGIEDPQGFFYPSRRSMGDPFLLTDIGKAVDILINAWKRRKKVLIHGDYDVDGITGAALLYSFMRDKGWNVEVYIPSRTEEGYGISSKAVEEFARRGGEVLLTVDCGTTAVEEIKLAKDLGLEVVVTDHHEVKEDLPPADAIVNPHRPSDPYPFKELAGVGVAFKLVQALADRFGMEFEDIEDLLDLVALGTVADMVELSGENRFYVKRGLKIIGKVKKRPGLKKLVERLGISQVRSRDISYKIAPRLNAAGRIGSAMDAFELLIEENPSRAERMVEKLYSHNTLRQEIETNIFKEAVRIVNSEKLYEDSVIVVGGEKWHVGVIGIVASRLASKYGKPALVISFSDGIGKGSARSVNGANIYEVFQELSDLFVEFGGHAMAVGFTIKKEEYERVREAMRNAEIEVQERVVKIDAEIALSNVNPELFEVIDMFEPFGLGNPPLIFLIKDLEIKKVSFFDSGNSASLVLKQGRRTINATWMGMEKDFATMIKQGAVKMDVVCEIEPNFLSPKLKIVDAKFKSGIEEIDSMVDVSSRDSIDREEIAIRKRISILGGDREDKAVFSDIRTRNAIILDLLDEAIFVVCCDILKEHIKSSVLRHLDEVPDVFYTIEEFLKLGRPDGKIVVLEPQILMALRGVDVVEEFINAVRGLKKIGVGTRIPEGVKGLLKDMGFKKFKAVFRKVRIALQDQRGKSPRPSSSSFVIVSRRPEDYSHLTSGQYYSSDMNKFQRISVVNLVKRGQISRLSTTPSTDGLPMFVKGGEVHFASHPLTLYELLDSIYPVLDEKETVLVLAYEDEKPDLSGLDGIYYEEVTGRILRGGSKDILRKLQDPREMI